MHDTALITGKILSETYGKPGYTVVDIGGLDVNGSLRSFFVEKGMNYICIDIESHPSVDIVIEPGKKLPFANASIDLIVSTSCFEHDPCFWLTFREMSRILKFGGYIYVNAPSNGAYHEHPGDNWRFYSDAGQALAYWSGYQIHQEEVFPMKVVETFHVLPLDDVWIDFVCIWTRTNEIDKNIITNPEILYNSGPLERELNKQNVKTIKQMPKNIRRPNNQTM